jgi:hypothetical protein
MELEINYSSKGKLKMFIDDEDYSLIKDFCINPIEGKLTTGSRTPYAITRKTIIVGGIKKRKQFYIHRIVTNLLDSPDIHIDHINGNTLDNRKNNLRVVTRSENMKNRKCSKSSRSKYLGLSYTSILKKSGIVKWRVDIKPTGMKKVFLGYYYDEDEGGFAYNVAANIVHGKCANLNNVSIGCNNKKLDIIERVNNYLSCRGISV